MALSTEDKAEIRALVQDAVTQVTAKVIANVLRYLDERADTDEPFTSEAEREILERMASSQPGVPHDEAMRRVFGE